MKPRPPLPPGPYLVVGLARSGAAASLALRARGERVIGIDSGNPPQAGELVAAGVELHTGLPSARGPLREGPSGGNAGTHSGEPVPSVLLEGVHTVVKSPGVPAEAPVVAAARARGVTVMGELELAWRLLPNEFVAVTGTNGKTTTVELAGDMHRQAGLPAAVAGNVGVALSGLVGKLPESATVVCEASSFQLEDTLAFAPEAAVLLNISPDHLDRHGTFEDYLAAKLQIFARQGPDDIAVLPAGLAAQPLGEARAFRGVALARASSEVAPPGRDAVGAPHAGGSARLVLFGAGAKAGLREQGGRLWWQGEPLLAVADIRLRGAHNLQNAMAAAAACLARGLPGEAVAAALREFRGVAHRLEEVANVEGVLYVNDSKATNVASTLVALDAMASDGLPVHLILGGLSKGQDFAPLAAAVQRGCRAVYLIGEDAPSIERALLGSDVPSVHCGTLERALALAAGAARPGEAVLLSPGCASFDQFADFEARGERFRELVESTQLG